jgi:5'-phosphate synthase pdxT subunit
VRRAGAEAVEVRTAEQFAEVDALIIPGGESTTMLKLLNETGLKEPLLRFTEQKPVFGTCAGAILLAREVRNPMQEALGVMDIAVERNAYGRQLDSRIVRLEPENGRLGSGEVEAVFIRAPIIRDVGAGSKVLLRYKGDPVLVEQGRHMVATFHPELSDDDRIHRAFIDKI